MRPGLSRIGVTLLDSFDDDGGGVGGGVDGGFDGGGDAGFGKKGLSKSSADVVRHLIPKRLPSAVRQSGTPRGFGNMYSLHTPKLFIDGKDRRK
jgi:hypothetical protein